MTKKLIEGRLFQIAWSGHTDPPAGSPRVLAEVFTTDKEPPAEFLNFPRSLGGGYSFCVSHVAPPPKQLPPETLAIIRKKRLVRRVTAKVPMFADFFVEQEVAKNKDFYSGVTDKELKQKHDEVLERSWERYYDLVSRPNNQVVIYAQEPQECKEKAARLQAEMLATKQRAQHRMKADEW